MMDAKVVPILLAEAAICLKLLHSEGLLEKPSHVAAAVLLTAGAFALRWLCMDHITLDYTTFLAKWVQFFRDNGGFAALSQPVGNYNVPYLYFLAGFSYLGISDLYLIKLLSILFDVVLAWAAMRLAGMFTKSSGRRLFCFFAVLLWPTVVLNGAYWGQCDSIYSAFAVLSVYLALNKKPALSMLSIAASFAFKLQAVFLMPLFAILLFSRRMKLRHFFLFPAAYLALVLPAVLAGRPLWDTVTLYFSQMGSVGSGLNYNSPSVFAFFTGAVDTKLAATLGIAAAAGFTAFVIYWLHRNRNRVSDYTVFAVAVLFSVAIPFLLPHMHDRYFFIADVLSLVFAVTMPEYFIMPLLCEFASLLGYHAYLKSRYLLPMSYGSAALLVVIAVLLIFIRANLQSTRARRI